MRNRFWHTSAISQHSDTPFAAAKRTAKWAAKIAFCCEIGFFSAKLKMTLNIPLFFIYTGHLSCERVSKRERAIVADCSSPCPSPTSCEPPIIFSGHHFQLNFGNLKWREPEEPSPPLLPAANEFRERSLFQLTPLNLRGQKLFPLRRSPRRRSLRRGAISLGQGVGPCKRGPGLKAQSS